ncbi:MAG: hypothetical protein JXB10_08685 [Pirellulales bacterium]|nr:hypothetical protein [Pirellulales bacterium]
MLLAFLASAGVMLPGCGQSTCSWPEGTGYVSKPRKRPATPHDVKKTTTKAEIVGVDGENLRLGKNSNMEYRESESLLVFPGARITYLCKDPAKYTMEDYNGDSCVLPYGITVEVDDYGQFVPVGYHPE